MSDHAKLFKILFKNAVRILFELLGCLGSLFIRPERNQCFSIDDEILLTPAIKLGEQIKSGRLTSEQVVSVFIRHIRIVDKHINAVVEDHFDKALERARQIDQAIKKRRNNLEKNSVNDQSPSIDIDLEQPFVGIPVSVKESIAIAGASFTAGVATRASNRAKESNPAVEQLIKSGMIPLVSTNTPCMNLWYDSYNLMHGRTKNPYDRSRIPGGSSGGEGALLAAAGSVVGVGSDLAGSIRIPANFCGIFGHKPTPMAVSCENSFPANRPGPRDQLRGIGPLTRYACDLLPMLKLMVTDEESRKRMRLDEPVNLQKIKVYYCDDLNDPLSSSCERDILNGLHAAVEHLVSKYGISAEQVSFDNFKYGLPLWSAVGEGGQYYTPEHPNGFTPFEPFVELVKSIFGTSLFPANSIIFSLITKFGAKLGSPKQRYLMKKAEDLREEFSSKLGQDGILLMPAHPTVAPHHHLTLFKILNCSYTAVANTLYAPITQCPLGMSREGLPFGVQLISAQYNDRLTLAVARDLERAFGGWIPPVKTIKN